jgi:lysozyme
VLRTPNIFRDMSALDEASALLGKLADGTIKTLEGMTKAAGQAKEKVDTARKDNAGTSANGTSSNGKTAAPASNRAAASESDAGDQIDRLKAIEEAKQAKLINDEQANNAAVGLLGGEVIPALALDKNVSMPMGIDISHWNGNVDWERVAAAGNVYFAFIKASDGTSVDNKFQLNWRDARDAGLACGAYHFWLPQKSGKSQAQTLIRQLGFLQRGDLPPVLDVEDTAGHSDFSGKSPSDLEDNIQEFLDTVEAEFGVKPIIYTGPAFWKQANRMNKSEKFTDYPLWISNWDPKNDPTLPGGWPTWDFWQFTEGGSIDGVHSPPTVDFSFYNGDLKSLWRMAGRNPSEITA